VPWGVSWSRELQYIASIRDEYVREGTESPLSACFVRYQF